MKLLAVGLVAASLGLAQSPKVSDCFKVHSMVRADEAHYWATWTNACHYTIDSVYVMVSFADHAAREVATGVWSLHFIEPGAHRTMRFDAPGKLSDFASVRTHRITSDLSEAFGRDPVHEAQVELAARNAGTPRIVGDAGERALMVQPAPKTVPAVPGMRPSVIGDSGEMAFRTDFPDPWRAVLTAQEAAVSPAPRGSFVRIVLDDKR
ncbi:MAG TPA: hypothetical protein VMT15_00320 [Bryobacteraceae bacterium]|nr:hypothetical protein [Bryobacteraceae bacterium]